MSFRPLPSLSHYYLSLLTLLCLLPLLSCFFIRYAPSSSSFPFLFLSPVYFFPSYLVLFFLISCIFFFCNFFLCFFLLFIETSMFSSVLSFPYIFFHSPLSSFFSLSFPDCIFSCLTFVYISLLLSFSLINVRRIFHIPHFMSFSCLSFSFLSFNFSILAFLKSLFFHFLHNLHLLLQFFYFHTLPLLSFSFSFLTISSFPLALHFLSPLFSSLLSSHLPFSIPFPTGSEMKTNTPAWLLLIIYAHLYVFY